MSAPTGMTKAAIAVYNPSDPLEVAVQRAAANHGGWLPAYWCRLMARAIWHLKRFDPDWLTTGELLDHRVEYFFAEHMAARRDVMVLPLRRAYVRFLAAGTARRGLWPLFVLVTRPIAHFLLREYEVRLLLDTARLWPANPGLVHEDIGGLSIVENKDVRLGDAIVDIRCSDRSVCREVRDLLRGGRGHRKAAIRMRERGVYELTEDARTIRPGDRVWDKLDRKKGVVSSIMPGELGVVMVEYEDGSVVDITQELFDRRFSRIKVAAREQRLGKMEDKIKQRLRDSRVVQRLFRSFGVPIERLDDLRIVKAPLKGKYAETDGRTMTLNTFMFERGNFFDKYLFVVIHELVHWLTRIKEKEAYFNDPEEVLGFAAALAYEIERSGDEEAARRRIYPKIEWHFSSEDGARRFYSKLYDKARAMLSAATSGT